MVEVFKIVQRWYVKLKASECSYKREYEKNILTDDYCKIRPVKCIHSSNKSGLCSFDDCPVKLLEQREKEYLKDPDLFTK